MYRVNWAYSTVCSVKNVLRTRMVLVPYPAQLAELQILGNTSKTQLGQYQEVRPPMSSGLACLQIKAFHFLTPVPDLTLNNWLPLQEMVAMVAAELAQQNSLDAAAQSVVERVKRLHHDAFVSGRPRASHCSRHEDMTLLVRTINYPLSDGSLTPTQGEALLVYLGPPFRLVSYTSAFVSLLNSLTPTNVFVLVGIWFCINCMGKR